MTKYQILLNIIDRIRAEAATTKYETKYLPPSSDAEAINQARSRAFIHLHLKVSFGLLDFAEREHFITDGTYDGGIDGYFINRDARLVYLIQSKFRAAERNFVDKEIALREILSMDVNRVLDGQEQDEQGNRYNGKLLQLQREISQTEDIARYKYRVVILQTSKMKYLPHSSLNWSAVSRAMFLITRNVTTSLCYR